MVIAVTGASGFIGRALVRAANERGWRVIALPRTIERGMLEGCDAVVHLAGESVAGRWTPQKKGEIFRSRVEGTRALVQAIAALPVKPRVLVSASAVGYYGSRGDEPLTEASAPGSDFLSGVCVQWEREAMAAASLGVRTVMLRTGIVIGRGGALEKMRAPFKFGAGGPLGSGSAFVPWIHLDDVVALYVFAIENAAMEGAVNAVAPDYATGARMAQAIGAAMRRPSLLPAPAFALRLVLGEFAETVLGSQLVLPLAAQDAGFAWKHPRLEDALQGILAPQRSSTLVKTFKGEQLVRGSLSEVFAFFSDARNLEAITPPSLGFNVRSAPDELREGAVIEYDLRLHGIPLKWKTLIARWKADEEFVDVQLHGPYALWEHRHRFVPVEDGVRIEDRVSYALPFQPFGSIAGGFVRDDVERIFAHRRAVIERRFP